MAVDGDGTFALTEFRTDIAQALGVDGYFYIRIQSTGDASGGQHRVRAIEPDDSALATRCLWIVDYGVETAYTTGTVELVGKLGGNDQQDRMLLATTRQAQGSKETQYLTGGGDLAAAIRARGWIVPSFGPGTQQMLLTIYFDNVNLNAVDMRLYGYYMNIRWG